jgi:hypothetical protein
MTTKYKTLNLIYDAIENGRCTSDAKPKWLFDYMSQFMDDFYDPITRNMKDVTPLKEELEAHYHKYLEESKYLEERIGEND